jgi:hypothetical protein
MDTPGAAGSPAVTIAGFALLLLAVVTVAQVVLQILALTGIVTGRWASGPEGNYLVLAAALAWGGIAMIRRWPRWRIWSGVLAWLMIFYLLGTFLQVFSVLDRNDRMPGETVRFALADDVRSFIPFLSCLVGLFVLWARRREPAASDVTLVGILLIAIPAVFFLVVDSSLLTLVIALAFAAAGVVIVKRWRPWRFVAGLVAWVLIVLSLIGIARMITVPPIFGDAAAWIDAIGQTVLAIMLGGFGLFVLRAKRAEPKNAAAAPG